MAKRVAIIGLGLIGGSLGLALRESTGAPLVTFDELTDSQLERLTGLRGPELSAARRPCHHPISWS
mgnify:CR=1 FL=1